jgi:hypothetical protein
MIYFSICYKIIKPNKKETLKGLRGGGAADDEGVAQAREAGPAELKYI